MTNKAHKMRNESNRSNAPDIVTLAAGGLGVYVDTIKNFKKKARIGPIEQNAPGMRTVRSSPCGFANGTARAKAARGSVRIMVLIVFAIGWSTTAVGLRLVIAGDDDKCLIYTPGRMRIFRRLVPRIRTWHTAP
jgi:hypothetical protein